MTHITSTMQQKTNYKPHMIQSMPNDAVLYINGVGNRFMTFTWTILRFFRVYAGLLVNGLMIPEFAC